MQIVFFGTPSFAATILDSLLSHPFSVVAVVTRPDKPKGRSGKPQFLPVKKLALEKDLPLYQPDKASSEEFAAFLKTLDADLFVLAAYAEILKENVLEIPSKGCINVHASLLPKYRGAAPIQRCLMAGDDISGVTIMKMERKLDAGEILETASTPVPEEMVAGELMEKLSHLGAEALIRVLQRVAQGEQVKGELQDPSLVTLAPKLKPEEGELDLRESSTKLHNQVRGVTPKPGAWIWVEIRGEKKRLLIKKTHSHPSLQGEIGETLSTSPWVIGCGEGGLELLEVQLEGKKALDTPAFLRGIPSTLIHFLNKS
ncbi:MAG: Methionyl-tRNA formyltransferase [Chlamydiae bacterium]|nr:Methionyl-tRNA formyltransferase [Chlamydiota bacterium]